MGNNIDQATRLEEILAEWDLDETKGYETMASVTSPVSLDLSNTFSNVSLTSPYTISTGMNFPNSIYTTASNTTGITIGATAGGNVPWMTQSPFSAPKIKLDGEGADVEVNGWSLVNAVKRIEERLCLFQPNPELEKEWEDLRELGEQYRKLEQHIRDKQATWDKLKSMPAPNID